MINFDSVFRRKSGENFKKEAKLRFFIILDFSLIKFSVENNYLSMLCIDSCLFEYVLPLPLLKTIEIYSNPKILSLNKELVIIEQIKSTFIE